MMKKLIAKVGILVSTVSSGCNTFDAAVDRDKQPPPLSSSPAAAPEPVQCGTMADNDGDGWFATIAKFCPPEHLINGDVEDCDDTDPTRNVPQYLRPDADGDGFGSSAPTSLLRVCVGDSVAGFAADQTDCDDDSSAGHEYVYRDADGDGFGAGDVICGAANEGWSFSGGDCSDDDDSEINPSNTSEVAFDGADLNCDGFDAPNYPAGAVVTWPQPACSGAVLAIVGFESNAVALHVANVGTLEVNDATLLVRSLGQDDAIIETLEFVLPTLGPGDVTAVGSFAFGEYQARFRYGEYSSPSADTAEPRDELNSQTGTTLAFDAPDAASTDAGEGDAGANDLIPNGDDASNSNGTADASTPWQVDGKRCARAKLPLRFSSGASPQF